MTRWTLAGSMALAALPAVAALDLGAPAAEAAPSESPFAGTYVGADPRGWYSPWTVTISNRGQITSSYSYSGQKGSISGRIDDDGRYSFTVSESYYAERDPRNGVLKSGWVRSSYESAGSMAPDAAGDLVGTEDTGRSFSWLRQ